MPAIHWDYVRVVIYEHFRSGFGEKEDEHDTYALVQHPGRAAERVDLWTRIGRQGSYTFDVKKPVVDLLNELGEVGWELVSALPATSGAHQMSTNETYVFKRPS